MRGKNILAGKAGGGGGGRVEGLSFGPKRLESPLAGGPGQAAGAPEPPFPPLKAVCPQGPWVPGLVHPHAVSGHITGGGQGLSLSAVICHLCPQGRLAGLALKATPPRKGLLFPRPAPPLFQELWPKRRTSLERKCVSYLHLLRQEANAADGRPGASVRPWFPLTTLICFKCGQLIF